MGRVYSCGSVGRCRSLRRGCLADVAVYGRGCVASSDGLGEGSTRQAAGGRRQAAGGRGAPDEACTGRGRSGPGHVRPVDHVRPVHHVRPVDAVHHGYVLSCRSRCVAERYLRRRAKHAWRRRRAAESMMMRMTRVRMWHKHGVLRWRDNIIWSSAA